MAEDVRTRQREADAIPGTRYERALAKMAAFVDRQENGVLVVKDSDRDWELCPQGMLKFYLVKAQYPDTALQDWYVYAQDIQQQSGRQRHQGGGMALFVIEGQGSTEVNGERIDWEAGDCILLPLQPEGVDLVHFNRGPGAARFLAFVYVPALNHVASELEQLAVCPGFTEQRVRKDEEKTL